MRGVRIARGVTAATLAAGPLFMLTFMASVATRSGTAYDPNGVGLLIGAIPFATVIGTFIAVLPNLLGAAALGALGRANAGVRLPACWALVGAAAGAVPTVLAAGPQGAGIMAAVGAACALICRWGTRWDD